MRPTVDRPRVRVGRWPAFLAGRKDGENGKAKSGIGNGSGWDEAWYAFYQCEAEHTYRSKLDPDDQDLSHDREPARRWSNPLEEGSIHGVVDIRRHKGRPVVV